MDQDYATQADLRELAGKVAERVAAEYKARHDETEILLALLRRMAGAMVDHGIIAREDLVEALEHALPVEGEQSAIDADFIAKLRRRFP